MLKGFGDRYLLVLFAMLALAGLVVALPRGDAEPPPGRAPLDSLARQLDGWVGVHGVPQSILPRDPRASESIRRTYTRMDLTVWIAVARYRPGNEPEWRPAVNLIAPERGAVAVERTVRLLAGTEMRGPAPRVNVISLRRPGRHTSVVYWYQLGETTVVGEYMLRLRLLRDALGSGRRTLGLVRVASDSPESVETFLQVFYPQLTALLSS